MAETLTSISERVDDIPRLLGQLERMGMPARLDEHFPTHGNWVGLSLGWVTVVWLTHLLSQADHRLSHAEPWAEQQLHTLRRCTGQRGFCRKISLALNFGYDLSLMSSGRRHERGRDYGELQGGPLCERHYHDLRAVVCGVSLELPPGGRADAGTRGVGRPRDDQSLGP